MASAYSNISGSGMSIEDVCLETYDVCLDLESIKHVYTIKVLNGENI